MCRAQNLKLQQFFSTNELLQHLISLHANLFRTIFPLLIFISCSTIHLFNLHIILLDICASHIKLAALSGWLINWSRLMDLIWTIACAIKLWLLICRVWLVIIAPLASFLLFNHLLHILPHRLGQLPILIKDAIFAHISFSISLIINIHTSAARQIPSTEDHSFKTTILVIFLWLFCTHFIFLIFIRYYYNSKKWFLFIIYNKLYYKYFE